MTAWLVAWLWQGTALAVGLSIALHLLPQVNAATRYLLWWGALVTLVWFGWDVLPEIGPPINPVGIGPYVSGGSQAFAFRIQPLPHWILSTIVMTWISVALFRMLRILPTLSSLFALKDRCRPFPTQLEDRLPLWSGTVKARHVRLMLSDDVPGAVVLGLHEPYIVIPSSLTSELTAEELDQIILHEYGHIHRRDDWTRLLQLLLEAAMWIHPATFLIGRELSIEREVACDDWVITRTGAPRKYAACLSRVVEWRRGHGVGLLAPALYGGRKDVFRRVDRLLNLRRNSSRRPSLVAAAAGMTIVAASATQLRALEVIEVAEVILTTERKPIARVSEDMHVSGAVSVPVEASVQTAPQVRAGGTLERHKQKPTPQGTAAQTFEQVRVEEPRHSDVVSVSSGGEAPVVVARTIQGVYAGPASMRPSAAAPAVTPWQMAGAAGTNVGSVAKRASVGLAGGFTKMGVSIARSF